MSFLSVKVSFRVAREEITKNKNFDSLYLLDSYKLVSFRGLHKLQPRPNWPLLGIKFKISDEHPRPFYRGVPPGVVNVILAYCFI